MSISLAMKHRNETHTRPQNAPSKSAPNAFWIDVRSRGTGDVSVVLLGEMVLMTRRKWVARFYQEPLRASNRCICSSSSGVLVDACVPSPRVQSSQRRTHVREIPQHQEKKNPVHSLLKDCIARPACCRSTMCR